VRDEEYMTAVATAMRAAGRLTELGLTEEEVSVLTEQFNPLVKIQRKAWAIPVARSGRHPYSAVEVHFEIRRRGDLRLDCELAPRMGTEKRQDQAAIAPLLKLKQQLITSLRHAVTAQKGELRATWAGAHSVPTALMAMKFNLGLPTEHKPQELAQAVISIIVAMNALIERTVGNVRANAAADH
jgi:hypothetical protein